MALNRSVELRKYLNAQIYSELGKSCKLTPLEYISDVGVARQIQYHVNRTSLIDKIRHKFRVRLHLIQESRDLRAYDTASEARASIGRYLDFYNRRRPHSSLDGTTPDHAYFTLLPLRLAA